MFRLYNQKVGDKSEKYEVIKQYFRELKGTFDSVDISQLIGSSDDNGYLNSLDESLKEFSKAVVNGYRVRYQTQRPVTKEDGELIEEYRKEIEHSFGYVDSTANLDNMISNPRYARRQLVYTEDKEKAITFDNGKNDYIVNHEYYNDVINIDEIISLDTWEKAVCHYMKYANGGGDSDDYILKGLLYCGQCRAKVHLYSDMYKCINECNPMPKKTLVPAVLNEIIDKMLECKESVDYYKQKYKELLREITDRECEIQKTENAIKNKAFDFLQNYKILDSKAVPGYLATQACVESIKTLSEKKKNLSDEKKEIEKLKQVLTLCQVQSPGQTMVNKEILPLHKRGSKYNNAKKQLVKKLLSNELKTQSMLSSIVKQVMIYKYGKSKSELRR